MLRTLEAARSELEMLRERNPAGAEIVELEHTRDRLQMEYGSERA